MKYSILLFWFTAMVAGYAAERPTLQSLIGREFIIEDDWAGQSLTLTRKGDSLCAVWRVLGSGLPVLSQIEYPVEMESPWQCVFQVQLRDKTRNTVKVAIGDQPAISVYLNGIKVVVVEKRPNQPPEPAP